MCSASVLSSHQTFVYQYMGLIRTYVRTYVRTLVSDFTFLFSLADVRFASDMYDIYTG